MVEQIEMISYVVFAIVLICYVDLGQLQSVFTSDPEK